jgi:hypothetical protein
MDAMRQQFSQIATRVNSPVATLERVNTPARTRFEEAIARLIRHKDVDGSGTLNADELPMPKKAFEKMDAGGDGEVNQAELLDFFSGRPEGLRAPGPRPPAPGGPEQDAEDGETDESSETITLLDTDGDGQVDTEEVTTVGPSIYEVIATRLSVPAPARER